MRRRDADYHRTKHRVHSFKYVGYIVLAVVFILLLLCICGAPFV